MVHRDSHKKLIDTVRDIVAPLVSEAGLYLEDLRLKRAGKYSTLSVVIDQETGPGNVDSQQLEDLSRAISSELDRVDPIPGTYTLEVSTPGAERALTQPRHWSRATGHLVECTFKDGAHMLGRLIAVKDAEASFMRYEEKNKQRVEAGECTLSLGEISSAHIVVEL